MKCHWYKSHEGIVLIGTAATILLRTPCAAQTFPGASWEFKTPAEVGMDAAGLDTYDNFLAGRGCVVRHGYMIHTWGDQSYRQDIASACKPWITHFLFKAVEDGRLSSLDDLAVNWEPCLYDINPNLAYKDRLITFRHMATQTSCYGVTEMPGAAFDYNDWQMALFWDTLFLEVYGATYTDVDATVLRPMLTDTLQCQDTPTVLAFGTGDRPGRVRVSVRDFARFGLLYLHGGNWNGVQLISDVHAAMAVTSPLSNSIPRTAAQAAQMCPGQRSIGSTSIPDDQTDHLGSYSYTWWTNGLDRTGQRHWPNAPLNTYGAFGHKNGKRAVVVMPGLDIVTSWNDTTLDSKPGNPANEALRLLTEAVLLTTPVIGLNKGEIGRTADSLEDLSDDTFTVTNMGVGTLDYAVNVNLGPGDPQWLNVDPLSGSSTGEADTITVSYAVGTLPVGTYSAAIDVSDNGSSPPASNSPQTVTVTLVVKTVLPDADEDGDVDQEDFGGFQACYTASGEPIGPACLYADFDGDGLVNQDDFGIFQACLSGANVPADKTCDDAYE